MTARSALDAFAPWSGLFVGAAAWFAHHQLASSIIDWDCRLGGPQLTVGLGLLFGFAAAAAGVVSWRVHRAQGVAADQTPHNRSVAGMIGAGAAGMFLLAIAYQSLAGAIVPACHR